MSLSITEYLRTSYSPDVDYVDGQIEERCVGEKKHGKLMFRLVTLLSAIDGVLPFLDTRVQVSPTRFRVPDVCVYLDTEPDEEVFTTPPFLCVEILSPEDRLMRTLQVAQDYLDMGVSHVWILDPYEKKAYSVRGGLNLIEVDRLAASQRIVLTLSEIFA